MMGLTSAAVFLLTAALLVAASNNDDFGFDMSDDLEVEFSEQDLPVPPRKLKGIPDVTATVGKLLQFTVPSDAFVGNVVRLEVKSPLPSWLSFDEQTNTFTGVPISTDKTDVLVSMAAHGSPAQNSAFDVFRVHVQLHPGKAQYISDIPCSKNPLVLTIYIDKKLEAVKPRQRISAMRNLAGFLGINISAFTLGAQRAYSDAIESSVILAGPGDIKKRTSKQVSNVDFLVGCENKLWDKYISLTHQLNEQAVDGTLTEVLGLPVLGWRAQVQAGSLERGRRETPPADSEYDYYEYSDYDDEDEDSEGDGEVTTIVPKITESASTTQQSDIETHPHRHHHGEAANAKEEHVPITYATEKEIETTSVIPSISSTPPPPSTSHSTTIKEDESTTYTDEDFLNYDDEDDLDFDESGTDVPESVTELPTSRKAPITSATTLRTTVTDELLTSTVNSTNRITESTTTERITITPINTFDIADTTMQESSTITSTTTTTEVSTSAAVILSTTTVAPTTTNIRLIPVELPITTTEADLTTLPVTTTTSTTTTSTTTTAIPITVTIPTSTTTEEPYTTIEENMNRTTITNSTITSVGPTARTTEMEPVPRNMNPTIHQRLKKLRITAGTVLSYFIPEDTFTDDEDGTNLILKFLDVEGSPLKRNFWIQFNERTREIYGLPLEEHVSKWEFIIEATDKEGASVNDKLEVTVQQHKGRRTVTHEFMLHMRIEKKHEFPTAVDWQLRTLRGLASLFHNRDLSQIVVRNIDFSTEFVTFTWTNETLPRSYCPKAELDYLRSLLVANSDGDPSVALSQVLSPELRVKNVEYRGIGQCEEKPELPLPPAKAAPTNFSPIPRNQVDHINATVGELLLFRVPDDTFYDPEDGDARNLKMSLLTIDREPLPSDHWLQFDVKNQEFYGVPLQSGRSEYQLVCEDRGGLTAHDGLVVVVSPALHINYNVEFSMNIEISYQLFKSSASMKRKFVEKLRDLFRDKDTSNIHISNILPGSTIVSWNNKSLPTDRCPHADIKRLRQVLINDDETLADRVEGIMKTDFPVSAITLTPKGVCQGELTVVHSPDIIAPIDDSGAAGASDEYLITFIVPAVIIAAMLVLAGIVACVLYRRRRTGKMNVEDDERQNFRSKGIPVIFQDEIDEKPDSGTKAPVILKEEKPPLAPPEYSKSGTPVQHEENSDAPYQPPPPFTSNQDNGRQPRPKPTPTYRKPPPYVPP